MSPNLFSPLALAPMIDWTYSHFRVFMRMLAPHMLLYTEMITTGAVENNPQRSLPFLALEHPLALQLGGSSPEVLARCAKIAEQVGYDEVNLNLGCPSDKVKAGHFGACLMGKPGTVVACVSAMREHVSIPVTTKIRIGIDHQDSYEFFSDFVHRLVDAGSQKIVVHARKAWLNGLSPKQNRTIPPVNYDFVYRITKELPEIPFVINGNITTVSEVHSHLQNVAGVMIGRTACDNPYRIAEIHESLYPQLKKRLRSEIFAEYRQYFYEQLTSGASLSLLVKPLFNFAHGLPGASHWKKQLMAILQTKKIDLLDSLYEFLLHYEKEFEFHSSINE
ncbi:MAG: tRNA dihydrouridine(20/20a) synthase DusA [Legionella sp.]|nr:tRNA dihydrouridine(20/20a) synthase DusA [Legionella sp.]